MSDILPQTHAGSNGRASQLQRPQKKRVRPSTKQNLKRTAEIPHVPRRTNDQILQMLARCSRRPVPVPPPPVPVPVPSPTATAATPPTPERRGQQTPPVDLENPDIYMFEDAKAAPPNDGEQSEQAGAEGDIETEDADDATNGGDEFPDFVVEEELADAHNTPTAPLLEARERIDAMLERRTDVIEGCRMTLGDGGWYWNLCRSPMCEHREGPQITLFVTGKIIARCSHPECSWGWQDLLARVAPQQLLHSRDARGTVSNFVLLTDSAAIDAARNACDAAMRQPNPDSAEISASQAELTAARKKPTTPVALGLNRILDELWLLTDDWPRRAGSSLFVDDPQHGIRWFDRRGVAGLFGWLREFADVKWRRGDNFCSTTELFASLEQTATMYQAIELLPHEPPIQGIYYRAPTIKLDGSVSATGDGACIRKFLSFFKPETTVDHDLLMATLMTEFWGGPAGSRPAIVFSSEAGRGVGKSAAADIFAEVAGGAIAAGANEDIAVLKQRLLSPIGRTKRVALLDNVKSLRFSWAELEGMITASVISGKEMYIGEGQRPNTMLWLITLNGASMSTDMAQWSVIIHLARGDNDGTWLEDTRKFVIENREALIADIIAALRAERRPLAKYSRWASWEADVLTRLPNPEEAQRLILARQGTANCELDEIEIVEQFFADKLRGLQLRPATVQVRIPTRIAAQWYSEAVGERVKTINVSRKLSQAAAEGQSARLAKDNSRTYGRCFIWTGAEADPQRQEMINDLLDRLAEADRTARNPAIANELGRLGRYLQRPAPAN